MSRGRQRLGFTIIIAGLLGAAAAQEFVFTTNRLRAEPAVGPSGAQLYQNELYMYFDGSEHRLTTTPAAEEWDPEPSPSGRYLAYVVNDTVIDWQADRVPEDWHWYLRVLDLYSGEQTAEWLLPESTGRTRYAGGFQIAWYPDEAALLAQLPSGDGTGRIARFRLDEPQPELLTSGIGVHLDASRGWVATTLNGSASVYVPLSGENMMLSAGEALGWADGSVVVGGQGQLQLVDPVTAEHLLIDPQEGYYPFFSAEPQGSRFAWTRYLPDPGETVVVVADGDYNQLASWLYADFVDSLHWLPDGTLLLSVLLGEHMAIIQLDISEGTEFVLVSSMFADNMNATPVP